VEPLSLSYVADQGRVLWTERACSYTCEVSSGNLTMNYSMSNQSYMTWKQWYYID